MELPFSSSISPSCRGWSCALRLNCIVLCLNSTCTIFQSLLCWSLVSSCAILVQFASWSLGYKGNELHELHKAAPLSLSFPPWTALCCTAPVQPPQSWCISPADQLTAESYFMLVARYLCLMAFSKLCFCHRTAHVPFHTSFLSRGKFFFLFTMGPGYGPSWLNKICFIILSWPSIRV